MQQGLVEMEVRLDEARKRYAPLGIDFAIDLLLDRLFDGNNPAVGNSDVHQRLFVADPRSADDHIHLHCFLPSCF